MPTFNNSAWHCSKCKRACCSCSLACSSLSLNGCKTCSFCMRLRSCDCNSFSEPAIASRAAASAASRACFKAMAASKFAFKPSIFAASNKASASCFLLASVTFSSSNAFILFFNSLILFTINFWLNIFSCNCFSSSCISLRA